MKTNAALVKSLLLAVSFGLVLPLLAKPPAKAGATPAKPAEAAKADGEEAEAKVPGFAISRKNGAFLSLTIEGNAFKLAFYDAKKKPTAPDAARAVIRWEPKNRAGRESRVLSPAGDGQTLVSPPIFPPYVFKLTIVLLDESGTGLETFVVDYR